MIHFPRLHIAQSTVNRILNVANGMQRDQARQVPPAIPPAVPDATAQGAALDQALQTPPAVTAPPEGAEGDMAAAALTGDSPMNAAIEQGTENAGNII